MRKPDGVIEYFLQPGELHFGDRYTRLRTVLGSCVSLVFWHPQELVGGMSHFMLPSRGCRGGASPDGRYADEAMQLMLDEIRRHGLTPASFRLRIFGGGNMFPELTRRNDRHIGKKNVEAALALLQNHCLNCVGGHVEGYGHRHLLFDIWSGHVHLRHSTLVADQADSGASTACKPSR